MRVQKLRDRALAMIEDINTAKSKRITDIQPVFQKLYKPFIGKAIFYKILETVIAIMMGFIPKHFLPEVKAPRGKRNDLVLIICPILAIFLTIIKTLISH
jgi:hypothetical protein